MLKIIESLELKKEEVTKDGMNYIFNLIVHRHNQLIGKIDDNQEIESSDRYFLENHFLLRFYGDVEYKGFNREKDFMSDVVKYFSKYPIENLCNYRNRQLYILYVVSKLMLNVSKNYELRFTTNFNEEETSLGLVVKFERTGICCIENNLLNIYYFETEDEFLSKMFLLFRKLRCLEQKLNLNNFSDEEQKIFLIEDDIISNYRDIYEKYCDGFFIEMDADLYAIGELQKEFGSENPIVMKICDEKLKKYFSRNFEQNSELKLQEYYARFEDKKVKFKTTKK